MADLSYYHGVRLTESPDTPSLLRVARQGITGINGTAPDADEAAFPLGLTLVTSLAQANALGTAGTLLDDVMSVIGEGGSYIIVNRVEHDEEAADLEANLIGDPTQRTGLYAFLKAKPELGYKPNVIVTAGNTGAFIDDGAVSVTLASGGEKLEAPVTVTASGGGTAADKELPTFEVVMGIGANVGKVASIKILTPGKRMTVAPTLAFAGGGDDADKVMPLASVNLGDVANGYVSALNTVCSKIGARAYISGPNTTNTEAIRWRQTINGGRILPIDPMAIKNVAGMPVIKPIAAVFAGVRSRVVQSSEGVSGSVSNKILRTIDGVSRSIIYPEDANYLNEHHVATVINERGGFRTWGSRLATDDLVWAFDSVRATADMVNEAMADLYFHWVDKKMKRANLKQMVEDGKAAMRVFALNDDIIRGNVWLTAQNTPTLNAGGKVFLGVSFEPVGIMEQIGIETHRDVLAYELLFEGLRENFTITQNPVS